MSKRVSRPPEQYLKNEYLVKGKSVKVISTENGWYPGTVLRWLVYYGITRRPQNMYKRTIEWRQRMSEAKKKANNWSGESNPNWKGGISREMHGQRATGSVKSWRHWVKVKDDFICQKCGIDGKTVCRTCHAKPRLHADHIKSWKDYPELRYDVSNGRTLCEDCHIRKIG